MSLDELDRVAIDEIGDVAFLASSLTSMPPVMLHVVADVADEVDVPSVVADELVEAVVLRVINLGHPRVALMPFADHARGIACALECFGEGHFVLLQNLATSRSSWTCTGSAQSVGGPRAGDTGGRTSGSPACVRIFRIGSGSVTKAISRISPPHAGHASGKSSATRAMSLAEAIREVFLVGGNRGSDAILLIDCAPKNPAIFSVILPSGVPARQCAQKNGLRAFARAFEAVIAVRGERDRYEPVCMGVVPRIWALSVSAAARIWRTRAGCSAARS